MKLIDENLKKNYYIFFELSPFTDLDFENKTTRGFKLGQLIEDDE